MLRKKEDVPTVAAAAWGLGKGPEGRSAAPCGQWEEPAARAGVCWTRRGLWHVAREEKGPHWAVARAQWTGPAGLQSPSKSLLNCRIEDFGGQQAPLCVRMGAWYRRQPAGGRPGALRASQG